MLNKIRALWYILTNKRLIYNVFFDSDHPLLLASENLEGDLLVTECHFVGTGSFPYRWEGGKIVLEDEGAG
jgi:hypothetical protein